MAKADTKAQTAGRLLTPLDYMVFLTAHDPNGAGAQTEAHFWRKGKMEGKQIARRRDGSPMWLTPPIIKATGVQILAALFGVRISNVEWPGRETRKEALALTCEVTVEGFSPMPRDQAELLTGRQLAADLTKVWPVPISTLGIGEVNTSNAGTVGRDYPQCIAFKRAYVRAVLDHLLLFNCYGDVEAPQFAQNADYEAAGGTERPAKAPGSEVLVSGRQWAKLPQDIRGMARALVTDHKQPREKVDQVYLDVNGEEDVLRDALSDWISRCAEALRGEVGDIFGGQGE